MNESSGWIAVTERLPDLAPDALAEGEPVLVWLTWSAPALAHLRTGRVTIARLARIDGQLAWRNEDADETLLDHVEQPEPEVHVTHWRPLPPPPATPSDPPAR